MRKDLSALLIIFGVLSIAPVFIHGNLAVMHLFIMCLVYAVAAGAWDLMMGFAGVFSFAQMAFYVIGSYASALITNRFGISPWLGIMAGGGIAAVSGVLIGLPCLKIKGSYVALLTFALHMLLEPLLKSEWGIAIGTGGTGGIVGIPQLSISGYTFSKLEVVPPFYTALGISFAAFYVMYRIIHSRWGLAFSSIRDSEPLARSLGVDYCWYKLIVFGVSAFLTGAIGAFYAHYIGVLSPRLLGLDMFLMLLVMQVIGGQGLFPGALIGAFIITFASEYLRVVDVYRLVIFGALIVALVAIMPKGIMGLIYGRNGGDSPSRVTGLVQRAFPGKACQKTGDCIREDS
ncbi:MAG: branched-chain amino acid ABC transporter permease [Nitrospirota bacterium]